MMERTVSNNWEILIIIFVLIVLVKFADIVGRLNIGVYE